MGWIAYPPLMNIDIVILKKKKIVTSIMHFMLEGFFFPPPEKHLFWMLLSLWNLWTFEIHLNHWLCLYRWKLLGPTKWDCDPGKYEICVLLGIYLIEEKICVLFSLGLFKWEDTTLRRTVVNFSGIRREFVCRMKLRRDKQWWKTDGDKNLWDICFTSASGTLVPLVLALIL